MSRGGDERIKGGNPGPAPKPAELPEQASGREGEPLFATLRISVGRYGARASIYLAHFGFAKAAAFLGPLLLARMLDPDLYGGIEFSWSTSALAATVLSAGIPAALPQLLLLRRPIAAMDIMAAAVLLPGAAALGLILLLALAGSPPAATLVVSCTVLALAQLCASSYSRTRSHRNSALWLEGLATHVVVLVALGAGWRGGASIRDIAAGTTCAAALLTVGSAVIVFRFRAADFIKRLRVAIRLGLPLLVYSLCSIWIVVSGRVYLGATLDAPDLAAYAVSFRIGSAVLIVQAILATALFARLYRLDARRYDRYLGAYLILIAMLGVLLVLLYPLILDRLALHAIDQHGRSESISIFPIVMLQIFGWNAWALLELRVARARRGAQAAWRTLPIFALFALLIAGLFWMNELTLRGTAWLVAAQMAAGVAVQLYVLWRRGLKMSLTASSLSVGAIGILAVGWAIG
jgi:O-antigen/teichoic acid export membrane protein